MLKTRKKWISILLTLAMLVGLMVPLAAPALADTTYSAVTTINAMDPNTDAASTYDLAKVRVKVDPTVNVGESTALVNVKDSSGSLLKILSGSADNSATLNSITQDVYGANLANKTWKLSFDADAHKNLDGAYSTVLALKVDAKGKAAGDVTVEFFNATGQLMNGTVIAGQLTGGDVEISTVDSGTWSDQGGAVSIRLKETAAGALDRTTKSVKFRLPSGFKWDAGATATVIAGGASNLLTGKLSRDNDDRDLILSMDGIASDEALTFDIAATVLVSDLDLAKYGAVNATISGDSKVAVDSIKVGTYGDYDLTVNAVESNEVTSGKFDQEIGKFNLDEGIKGSILSGRTIILTLPEEAKWSGTNYPSISSGDSKDLGDIKIGDWSKVGTDNRTIKATITGTSSAGGGAVVVFKGGKITVQADYTGDINLEVSGSAGAKGTIKVADAVAPVSVTASAVPEVVIGNSAVAAGDLTLTEKVAEAISSKDHDVDGTAQNSGYIYIKAPNGVTFASLPEVAVTEGDLQLGTVSKNADDDIISVKVKAASSTPATVKVSGISLTVDRTVPVGNIEFKVGGNAIVENAIDDYFTNNEWMDFVPVANVITPPPTDTTNKVVFTLGQTTFTLNGTEQTMDVAPYVKNARTYVPIRYVAAAIGVSSNNIYWDGSSAILMKDNKVVSFKIGESAITVNGVTVPIDSPAELSNDRTMVPVRAIAQAFGASVVWDDATQTVTIN